MLDAQETSLFVDNVNIQQYLFHTIRMFFTKSLFIYVHKYMYTYLYIRIYIIAQILEDSKIIRQQLSDIKSRHAEVLKLEKSLIEIRALFADVAFLTEKQVCDI